MADNSARFSTNRPGSPQFSRPALILLVILSIFLVTALTGCVQLTDLEASQDYQSDVIGTASPEQVVGQSLQTARHSPYSVQIWLRPQEGYPTDSMVITEIHSEPGSTQPLRQFSYPMREIAGRKSITVPLNSVPTQANGRLYISLRTTGGMVDVLGRDEEAYPPGSAFLNHEAIPGDLSFRFTYTYDWVELLTDTEEWLGQSWLILPFSLLLILPGWLLLSGFKLHKYFDWGEKVALSIGLSLSAIPTVLLWTTTTGLHWSRLGIVFAAGLLIMIFAWQQWRQYRLRTRKPVVKVTRNLGITLGLIAIFLLSLAVRLILVRDLATPAWVDPVHHATITRLIIEHGAYPNNYAPYLELDTASYHAGFHANLAAFLSIAQIDLASGMIIYGQVLNALVIFAVYLFTTTLVHNRTAGLLAALFAGLFTPMPAYYTSWGRYTQLAGLLILPAAMAMVIKALELSPGIVERMRQRLLKGKKRPLIQPIGWILLASLLCGGLFLVHYRVLAFLGCMIIAWMTVQFLFELRHPGFGRRLMIQLIILSAIAVTAVLVTLPWWPSTLNSLLIPYVSRPRKPIPLFSDFSWSLLTAAQGTYVMVLAGLGLLWGMIQKRRFPYIILIWIVLLFALANVGRFLPSFGGLVNNTSVTITIFMPAAALAGYLFGWVIEGWQTYLTGRWQIVYKSVITLLLLLASLYSARSLIAILNPVTILSRQADLQAIQWIDTHLPQDAVFAVNPFMWGYSIYAGSDGGYWITPLAGRQTIPSPVLYGLEYSRSSSQNILNISRSINENRNNPQQLHQVLQQAGVDYLYIGRRTGDLSPVQISKDPFFKQIYAEDGVYIYQVLPAP